MAETLFIEKSLSKEEKYKSLIPQIEALITGETDLIANLANISSVLYFGMNFFWVGFYAVKNNEMVLAPFHGTVACTRIRYGKGVCGSSWKTKKTIIVPNVDEFPGHIACSSNSKSEIVLPIIINNEVKFVLDVDSDKLNNFDYIDEKYLRQLTEIITKNIEHEKN